MGKRLFVGNLAWATTSDELQQHFAQAGTIVSCEVKMGPDGRSRGFAFVEYESEDQAQNAIGMFDGKEMGGRPLVVKEARPMTDRPRRDFGGGRGGYDRGGQNDSY